jgi:hypothetical protein
MEILRSASGMGFSKQHGFLKKFESSMASLRMFHKLDIGF